MTLIGHTISRRRLVSSLFWMSCVTIAGSEKLVNARLAGWNISGVLHQPIPHGKHFFILFLGYVTVTFVRLSALAGAYPLDQDSKQSMCGLERIYPIGVFSLLEKNNVRSCKSWSGTFLRFHRKPYFQLSWSGSALTTKLGGFLVS